LIALYPDKVMITQVADVEECPSLADPAFAAQCQGLVAMLSDAAETAAHPNLNPLSLTTLSQRCKQ
jgi:hypothetical protein